MRYEQVKAALSVLVPFKGTKIKIVFSPKMVKNAKFT